MTRLGCCLLSLQVQGDGEAERLRVIISELQRGRADLLGLVDQKNAELTERTTASKGYLDKIVSTFLSVLFTLSLHWSIVSMLPLFLYLGLLSFAPSL